MPNSPILYSAIPIDIPRSMETMANPPIILVPIFIFGNNLPSPFNLRPYVIPTRSSTKNGIQNQIDPKIEVDFATEVAATAVCSDFLYELFEDACEDDDDQSQSSWLD